MSQSKIESLRSSYRKSAVRQEMLPSTEPLIRPTRDTSISNHTSALNCQPSDSLAFERKIQSLERELQDYQFEHEANMVYNKQFKILGKLLGSEDMEFDQIRQKIEDIILNTNSEFTGSAHKIQTKSRTTYYPLAYFSYEDFKSDIHSLSERAFFDRLLSASRMDFMYIIALGSPENEGIWHSFYDVFQDLHLENERLKNKGSTTFPGNATQATATLHHTSNAEYEEQLIEKNGHIGQLAEELERLNSMLVEKNRKIGEVKDDNFCLQEKVDQLTKQNSQYLLEIAHLKREIEDLLDKNALFDLDDKDKDIQLLKAELRETKLNKERECSEMIARVDEVMGSVDRYKETVQELEADNNSLQRQVWLGKSGLQQLQAEISQLKMTLEITKRENISLEKKLQAKQTDVALDSQISGVTESHHSVVLQLQNQIAHLKKQITERDEQLQARRYEISDLCSQKEAVDEELITTIKQLEYYKETNIESANRLSQELQFDYKEEAVDNMSRRQVLQKQELIVDLKAKIRQLQAKVTELEQKLEQTELQLRKIHDQQEKNTQKLTTEYEELKKINEQLKSQIKAATQQLMSRQAEFDELRTREQHKYRVFKQEHEVVKKQLEQTLKEQYEGLMQQISQRRHEQLQEKVKEYEERYSKSLMESKKEHERAFKQLQEKLVQYEEIRVKYVQMVQENEQVASVTHTNRQNELNQQLTQLQKEYQSSLEQKEQELRDLKNTMAKKIQSQKTTLLNQLQSSKFVELQSKEVLIKNIESEVALLQQSIKQKDQSLKQLQTLVQGNTSSAVQLERYKKMVEEWQDKINQMQAQLTIVPQLRQQLESKSNSLDQLHVSHEELRASQKEIEIKNNLLREQNQALSHSLTQLNEENSSLKQLNNRLSAQIENLNNLTQSLQASNNSLKQMGDSFSSQRDQLTKQINTLLLQKQNWSVENKQKTNMISDLNQQVRKLAYEKIELTSVLNISQTSIRKVLAHYDYSKTTMGQGIRKELQTIQEILESQSDLGSPSKEPSIKIEADEAREGQNEIQSGKKLSLESMSRIEKIDERESEDNGERRQNQQMKESVNDSSLNISRSLQPVDYSADSAKGQKSTGEGYNFKVKPSIQRHSSKYEHLLSISSNGDIADPSNQVPQIVAQNKQKEVISHEYSPQKQQMPKRGVSIDQNTEKREESEAAGMLVEEEKQSKRSSSQRIDLSREESSGQGAGNAERNQMMESRDNNPVETHTKTEYNHSEATTPINQLETNKSSQSIDSSNEKSMQNISSERYSAKIIRDSIREEDEHEEESFRDDGNVLVQGSKSVEVAASRGATRQDFNKEVDTRISVIKTQINRQNSSESKPKTNYSQHYRQEITQQFSQQVAPQPAPSYAEKTSVQRYMPTYQTEPAVKPQQESKEWVAESSQKDIEEQSQHRESRQQLNRQSSIQKELQQKHQTQRSESYRSADSYQQQQSNTEQLKQQRQQNVTPILQASRQSFESQNLMQSRQSQQFEHSRISQYSQQSLIRHISSQDIARRESHNGIIHSNPNNSYLSSYGRHINNSRASIIATYTPEEYARKQQLEKQGLQASQPTQKNQQNIKNQSNVRLQQISVLSSSQQSKIESQSRFVSQHNFSSARSIADQRSEQKIMEESRSQISGKNISNQPVSFNSRQNIQPSWRDNKGSLHRVSEEAGATINHRNQSRSSLEEGSRSVRSEKDDDNKQDSNVSISHNAQQNHRQVNFSSGGYSGNTTNMLGPQVIEAESRQTMTVVYNSSGNNSRSNLNSENASNQPSQQFVSIKLMGQSHQSISEGHLKHSSQKNVINHVSLLGANQNAVSSHSIRQNPINRYPSPRNVVATEEISPRHKGFQKESIINQLDVAPAKKQQTVIPFAAQVVHRPQSHKNQVFFTHRPAQPFNIPEKPQGIAAPHFSVIRQSPESNSSSVTMRSISPPAASKPTIYTMQMNKVRSVDNIAQMGSQKSSLNRSNESNRSATSQREMNINSEQVIKTRVQNKSENPPRLSSPEFRQAIVPLNGNQQNSLQQNVSAMRFNRALPSPSFAQTRNQTRYTTRPITQTSRPAVREVAVPLITKQEKLRQQQQLFTSSSKHVVVDLSESSESGISVQQKDMMADCCQDC